MKRIAAHDPELASADLVAENLDRLRALFPDAFRDGSLDFNVLRQLLGGAADEFEEKYGLNWHGKRAARQLALTPSTSTLRPCSAESIDWQATQNLMIEGDNLEVLKLLQRSYAGKVKAIYIDPPYNTGGNFVYTDDFRDNLANYLLRTGQAQADGGKTTSRSEGSGRLHSDWLSMIYPRLKLARNLLRPDGVIFISIDDHELDNLMKIGAEVFGEENFCGLLVWEKKKKPSFLNANMGSVTDYIVSFARDRGQSPPFAAGRVEDGKKYPFNNAGNAVQTLTFPAGSVRFACPDQTVPAQDMSEGNIHAELLDDVRIIAGRNMAAFRLKGQWRYTQQKLDAMVRDGAEIAVSKLPFRPNYVNRSRDAKKTANLLSHRTNGVSTNEDATEEIRQLFGADVMSHPKPSGLLQYLVRAVTTGDDIVLDFFAGSGTTAHGVWAANLEDGGRRRFILVQLPELIDATSPQGKPACEFCQAHALPPTIAEICKERLRRTAQRLQSPGAGGGAGQPSRLPIRTQRAGRLHHTITASASSNSIPATSVHGIPTATTSPRRCTRLRTRSNPIARTRTSSSNCC